MAFEIKANEFVFELIPVGIGYRCENCHDGEMYPDDNGVVTVPLGNGPFMRDHKCTKCGCKMKLPKTYPYIEWLKEEEYLQLKAKIDSGDYSKSKLEEEYKNKGLLYEKVNQES